MSHNPKARKHAYLRHLIHSCLVSSLAVPVVVNAQAAEDEIEEVVVTGSYIRNSKFTGASPIDSISQDDLLQSGSPGLGQYIRDLTYTQNTDTVANVLGSTNTGGQDSVTTGFNLRGLGDNSTLTLMDGTRVIRDTAIASLLPDIATQRLEVVLDGGSALYGSDAVAGVVNLIPIKQYDGFRVRAYYSTPFDGGMEEPRVSYLFGKSFDNDINWVNSLEYSKKTPLMRTERPREFDYDNQESATGNPGSFVRLTGATTALVDPSCGTFNNGVQTDKNGQPSGVRQGTVCRFNYGTQHDYARESQQMGMFNNLTWDAQDWLQFELQSNLNYSESTTRTSATTAVTTNHTLLPIPANHPANPFGVAVRPTNWRPFSDYGTLPSHLHQSNGSLGVRGANYTWSHKLSARYDVSDTWTGYSYYSRQKNRTNADDPVLLLPRMQAALNGRGGVNGNEWWNPFGSQDPRSPFYVAGVTSNSQELVDWMWEHVNSRTTAEVFYEIFETTLTGEVLQLPAGALQTAFGFQWRDRNDKTYAGTYAKLRQDYGTDATPAAALPVDRDLDQGVKAIFLELEVPILETLSMQLAGRTERFGDQGLEATTPKVALRWEALPNLAIRASWGESFLAPTPLASRPFDPNEPCAESFSGNDLITGTQLNGSARCSTGNPNLKPEKSEIKNIGFTWQPIDSLELSLDYQDIEYTDRFAALLPQDVTNQEFERMKLATGISNYSAANPAHLAQGVAFLAANPNPYVQRDPANNYRVVRTLAFTDNVSSLWVELYDARARYTYETSDLGTFQTTLSATYYSNYEYADSTKIVRDGRGFQNANTGIAPPLPKIKSNLRTNWFMGNHSASISANYQHHVVIDKVAVSIFDGYKMDRQIDSQVIVNAQYAYVFDDFMGSELTLSGGISNLFDQKAQRLPVEGGFESRLHTPWNRGFWLSADWNL
ncbi:MAG: TonB-dependent receptor [Gammaproteobacteria bacterium]|nr:TonB-dependent receptor [Gammaproteobacteria bacterium]MDP2142024.1 TonB-dependent receptor [Gammaproteobacteria bacterium]MDP2348397.1 TonB-dependent receptor [Gammaproteobacteria bacterium]